MSILETAQRFFRQSDVLPQGEARHWFDQMPPRIQNLWGKNAKDAQKILQKNPDQHEEKDQALLLLQMTRILTVNDILSDSQPNTHSLRTYYADYLYDISKLEAERLLNEKIDEAHWKTTEDLANALLKSPQTL